MRKMLLLNKIAIKKSQTFAPFIFLLFLAAPESASAQYKSIFGETHTSWNILLGTVGMGYMTDSLVVNGDTLIDNKNWKIIKGYDPFDNFSTHSYFYLREDTMAGTVSYILPPDTFAYVLDFSLNTGDTFCILPQHSSDCPVVDSVFIKDNKKYIVLNKPADHLEKLMLIEGVGTNIGFPFLHYIEPLLLCQYKSQVLNYSTPVHSFANTCRYRFSTSVEDQDVLSKVNVYPNPADNILNIEFSESLKNENFSYKIYSVTGKLILEGNFNGSYSLDLTSLIDGIYLLTLNNQNYTKTIKIHKF